MRFPNADITTFDLLRHGEPVGGRMLRGRTDHPLSERGWQQVTEAVTEGGGRVITHKALLLAVWGPAHGEDTQYLRVFIGQLRQKLEAQPSAPTLIVTEPGVGYRFVVPNAT